MDEAIPETLNIRSTKNTKHFKRIKLQSHSIQSQLRSFQTNPPVPLLQTNQLHALKPFSLHKQTKGKVVQRIEPPEKKIANEEISFLSFPQKTSVSLLASLDLPIPPEKSHTRFLFVLARDSNPR